MCFLQVSVFKLSDSSTTMNRLDIKLKNLKHPSDVTLVVKDGKEFQAHRSVLSQASSFFEKLLNSNMKENNEGVIRLEIVSESQMADILEFIYNGSVQISTQENAENLFQLADYLLLPNLKAFAGNCLDEHITTANCFTIYHLAEKYLCQDLTTSCRTFIHSNFSSVADSDDFLNLSSHEVEKLISSDGIAIDAEKNVFELVLRWIDHDKSQRRVKFRDLFRHVRLTCISRDFLASNVVTNDLVKEDEECLESVYLALQWYDRSTNCDIPRPHPPRKALERDVIVVTICKRERSNHFCFPSTEQSYGFPSTPCEPVTVCGSERPLFHTNFYLPSTEQWYRLPSTSCEPTHVFSHRGKVFVVTKGIDRSQCYDPELNRWSPAPWTKLDSNLAFMTLDHRSLKIHDVVVIKDEICFIVGGGLSFSLWRYSVDLNSMTSLCHWVNKAAFCTVAVGTLIYVVGGGMFSGYTYGYHTFDVCSKNALSHCSAFDVEGNAWKEIAPLKEARRDAFGVSKHDEKVFIAGGHGIFFDWLNSCEVYNIATNEWQFIGSLTVSRVQGKMVLINETIYVLGGRVKRPFQDPCVFPDGKIAVEWYDEERDEWNDRTIIPIDKMSKLGYYEFCLKICSLRLFKGVEFDNLYPIRY